METPDSGIASTDQAQRKMTIYDRLGGAAAVRALLDGLYSRATGDPLLRPFLEDLDLERLKKHQHAFLSQAMGGPEQYDGRPLETAHARLRIENRHFDAFVGHVRAVLEELGASEELAVEILSRVEAVRPVIVNTATVGA